MRFLTLRGLIIIVLLLGIVTQVAAQAPPASGAITLAAESAFGGTVKYGEWLPIYITLENSGPTVRGVVQVRGSARSGGTQQFAQHVELANGARKQVTLYVTPTNFARRLTVEFAPTEAGDALASGEVALRPVPTIRYVVGIVGPEDGGLKPLATESFRGTQGGETNLVPMTLASLPERAEALRSLDLIILSGVDSAPLSAAQRTALEQYVSNGGLLAIGGGVTASRTLAGIPDSLRPVTLDGETSVETLPALATAAGEEVRVAGPFAVARGTPVEGSSVRVEQDGLPLAVERAVGQGAILWLALDPALSPFDAWAGAGPFWKNLVGSRAIFPPEFATDVSARQMINEQLGYALMNLPSLDLPSLRLLIPLLALYIFAVGPLTYFLLRRRRRLELAWLVIPVLTLLFSGAAYLIGFQLRGDDLIVNRISLVRVVPGSKGGTVQSMIGLFSPTRQSYTLEVSGGDPLLSPSTMQSDPFGPSTGVQQSSDVALFFQGEPATVEELVVNQWALRAVMGESVLSEGFEVSGEAVLGEQRLEGTIRNDSSEPWQEVIILVGERFDRLGPINPGDEQSFSISLPSNSGAQVFFQDLSWQIFGESAKGGNIPREDQVRQQILSTITNTPQLRGQGADAREPLFLIWTNRAPLDVAVNGTPVTDGPATTLIYGNLPTRFGEGTIQVPRGLTTGRIVENDGNSCYNPTMVSLAPNVREAVVEFSLPSRLRGLSVQEMSLFVLSDEGSVFTTPGVAIRDATTGEWIALDQVRAGRNTIADAARYFTPERTVQVQITNERANQGGCLYLDLSLKGTLPAPSQP